MAPPRIDELLARTGSRYSLVVAAAKRARQLNDYRRQTDAGSFEESAVPPMVPEKQNDLSTAFEEIRLGKLIVSAPGDEPPLRRAPASATLDFGFDDDSHG